MGIALVVFVLCLGLAAAGYSLLMQSAWFSMRVQEVAMGGGYLASGTIPARPVPLVSGPVDRADDGDDRADGTRG